MCRVCWGICFHSICMIWIRTSRFGGGGGLIGLIVPASPTGVGMGSNPVNGIRKDHSGPGLTCPGHVTPFPGHASCRMSSGEWRTHRSPPGSHVNLMQTVTNGLGKAGNINCCPYPPTGDVCSSVSTAQRRQNDDSVLTPCGRSTSPGQHGFCVLPVVWIQSELQNVSLQSTFPLPLLLCLPVARLQLLFGSHRYVVALGVGLKTPRKF